MNELLLSDLSEMFGLSHSHLRRACREGRIEARKLGRFWLATPDAVAEALSTGQLRLKPGRPRKEQENE